MSSDKKFNDQTIEDVPELLRKKAQQYRPLLQRARSFVDWLLEEEDEPPPKIVQETKDNAKTP